MYVQTGKTFFATVIAVVLSLGGIAVLSSESHKVAPGSVVRTEQSAQPVSNAAVAPVDTSSTADTAAAPDQSGYEPGYERGYKSGYRDGHQDCRTDATGATAGSAYYSGYSGRTRVTRSYYPNRSRGRVRVAGARYTNTAHRGHSTRNMILTIAGPAAVGAGIGGIIRGGKGAGIGALLGGGGGALYYLARHRR
jgi:hypothetical protein